MDFRVPSYYGDFKCLAGDCPHSCCIGWRIGLDDETRKIYESAEGSYATALRGNICSDEDGCYIPTLSSGRCPHLDEYGLCRVILEYGDGYLSEICREHPRFYNRIGDRIEVGLGASCPEAARLILEGESSLALCENDADTEGYSPLGLRSEIAKIITNATTYADAEAQIMHTLSLPDIILSDGFITASLSQLEYLHPENEALFAGGGFGELTDAEKSRIFSYFIYRHLASAEDEGTTTWERRFFLCFQLFQRNRSVSSTFTPPSPMWTSAMPITASPTEKH